MAESTKLQNLENTPSLSVYLEITSDSTKMWSKDRETPTTTATGLDYRVHHYASNKDLQQVGVWPVDIQDKSKYWIIYIHGGAWVDPEILHQTFTPPIDKILTSGSPLLRSSIAAFASIDYRLTADPNRYQDPETTPPAQLRDARHPDHVHDVRSAIAFLQDEYGFGSNYLLTGHSAGATLAFQAVADITTTSSPPSPSPSVALPRGIVGFCGIYHLSALFARSNSTYTFIRDVFGSDQSIWDQRASPATWPNNFSADLSWPQGTQPVVILASSAEDELVDEPEIDSMVEKLNKDGMIFTLIKDMKGRHDEIWSKGDEMARVTLLAMEQLVKL